MTSDVTSEWLHRQAGSLAWLQHPSHLSSLIQLYYEQYSTALVLVHPYIFLLILLLPGTLKRAKRTIATGWAAGIKKAASHVRFTLTVDR
jgi:hypothetical protein